MEEGRFLRHGLMIHRNCLNLCDLRRTIPAERNVPGPRPAAARADRARRRIPRTSPGLASGLAETMGGIRDGAAAVVVAVDDERARDRGHAGASR